MYACCHRNKESAKASSSDYNLVDAAREENQLLATDSYPEETTNEDSKFLKKKRKIKKQ